MMELTVSVGIVYIALKDISIPSNTAKFLQFTKRWSLFWKRSMATIKLFPSLHGPFSMLVETFGHTILKYLEIYHIAVLLQGFTGNGSVLALVIAWGCQEAYCHQIIAWFTIRNPVCLRHFYFQILFFVVAIFLYKTGPIYRMLIQQSGLWWSGALATLLSMHPLIFSCV